MRPLPTVLVCVVALAGCDSGDDAPADTRPGGADPAVHLRALQRIADENGGHRAAGTTGYRESARYVAEALRDAGWRVRLQRFRYPWWGERSSSLELAPGGELRPGRDFRPVIYSGEGVVDGPIEPVGTGCTQGEVAAIDAGDIAVALPRRCLFRVKAANARRAGAAGLLIVDPARGAEASTGTLVEPGPHLPAAILRRGLAPRLRAGVRARLRVDAESGPRTGVNVVAQSGGRRGAGVVMAGGHLDSVEAGPGINDNGSGVAALLALAESTGPSAPGAPIRLGFWDAEELGLYGSNGYVDALGPGRRRELSAYVNLDIVGSPNAVRAVYTVNQSLRRARPAARRIERLLSSRVEPAQHTSGASDHQPFAQAGVPVGGLFTGASEHGPGGRPRDPCYHLSCDTLRNVDVGLVRA
ncbi:MAG TPA: M28 family peptidase, partial [Thermoleophilaceae bacterium]|nr:M28 family peptidase [Thermoleophilaceae bacterium]